MSRGLVLLALGVFSSASVPVVAQKPKEPARPSVPGDRNDPLAYYRYAAQVMEQRPAAAAAALYWATALDPTWPEALYARRVAELRSDERRMIRYLDGDKRARREMAAADSLYFRARMLEPFLVRSEDRGLVMHYLNAAIRENVRRQNPQAPENEIRYAVSQYVDELIQSGRDPAMSGWLAFADQRYEDALRWYARAIGKKHERPDLHDDRATIFFLRQNYDSAAAELEHALVESKKENEKETEVIYRPRALLYYRLAVVELRRNRLGEARQALSHALEEDLAFFPAHLTLAALALATGDSATATQEMQLAVELKPDEPTPFLRQAELFVALGRPDEAREALLKVAAMAPRYARPHLELARIADRTGRPNEAREEYRRYLELAVPRGKDAEEAARRLRELGAKP